MSKIAQRLTGLSGRELFNVDFKSLHSIKDVCRSDCCYQDIRIFAGLIIGTDGLNKQREKLRKTLKKEVTREKEKGRMP
ncbi:MAG: hypothetical protein NUV61_03465 [Candidatus Azambacteria bacterium]|nr:hypothetical protein [Candidatus Azambacteria bacterium]